MSRTALITGGAGGLGAAVTSTLLAGGWRVVVPRRGRAEPDRLPAHEALTLVEADLFDPDAVQRCVDVAAGEAGRPLRAVVNLVGGFAMGGRVHETPVEDFEEQLRLNLRPTYLVCQAALPHLVSAGGGAVVCVSSQATRAPFPGAAGYLTAKTAVLGLVGALHAEYARDGVRVNAILPGVIDTPGNRASQPDADRRSWTPAQDVADTVAFLCGDRSSAVRGAHIRV
ncbi:SDR family NAD(P)-dependent oxidoreductase [Rugosimonospora africana]|uniref:Short-chain dehydrogenase n=1 Tax=Rugosimonospora africana TaxID=556532 RepID=A0A8J3QY26_9ACTN|nr:SDR family NAD(P)-dependent oxidoreductase [Rugosimonospora africana]GIH17948.1 short-chain dehydrogenase [Rugosimonospora africana]